MDLAQWLDQRGGIAHRHEALHAGYSVPHLRRAVRSEVVQCLRRAWLALPSAPVDLRIAASAGGRVACVSVARRRRWWIPEGVDEGVHLRLRPHAASPGFESEFRGVVHWTTGVAPASRFALVEPVEDALAHIASCLAREPALALWESAIRIERLSVEALRAVRWPTRAARECAATVSGLSDSGLETIFVVRLSPWRLPLRQQIVLAGRPVDVLIGESLVVQIDGFAHHSSSADRTRDLAHDAELRLRGYTVLRFSYAQVMHDWPFVERTIARAIAAGLHVRRAA